MFHAKPREARFSRRLEFQNIDSRAFADLPIMAYLNTRRRRVNLTRVHRRRIRVDAYYASETRRIEFNIELAKVAETHFYANECLLHKLQLYVI